MRLTKLMIGYKGHDLEISFAHSSERDAAKQVLQRYKELIFHVATLENEYWKDDFRGTIYVWYKDEGNFIPSRALRGCNVK